MREEDQDDQYMRLCQMSNPPHATDATNQMTDEEATTGQMTDEETITGASTGRSFFSDTTFGNRILRIRAVMGVFKEEHGEDYPPKTRSLSFQ
jgi:hypothetical protein